MAHLARQNLNALDRISTTVVPDTDRRQKETKQLLVAFALYHDALKLGLNMGVQRNHLRSGFRAASQKGQETSTTIRQINR